MGLVTLWLVVPKDGKVALLHVKGEMNEDWCHGLCFAITCYCCIQYGMMMVRRDKVSVGYWVR